MNNTIIYIDATLKLLYVMTILKHFITYINGLSNMLSNLLFEVIVIHSYYEMG